LWPSGTIGKHATTILDDQRKTTRIDDSTTLHHLLPSSAKVVKSDHESDRVQITRPFNISGVDYCGPFLVHYKIRGKKPH